MGGMETAISAASAGLQMVSQHNQAKAQAQAQTNQINQQNQMMALQQEQRARQQRDLLKRQAATARASLVAGGGSAAALLTGLTKQTEQGIADGYDALALRADANNPTQVKDAAGDILNGWNKAQQVWGAMRPLLL